MSLSLSKMSVSKSSDIRIWTCINLNKISSFITLLHKAMISIEGSDETKWRGYLNLWSLCCCHMVLRVWGQEGSVCV